MYLLISFRTNDKKDTKAGNEDIKKDVRWLNQVDVQVEMSQDIQQIDAIIGISMADSREVNPPASMSCCGFDGKLRPTAALSYVHIHTVSTSILYKQVPGGRGWVDIVFDSIHSHSLFNFSHQRSCHFLPTSVTLLTLSAITLLFIRFQPSVSAPIKWLEGVRLWTSLYEGSSREHLSLAL